VLIRFRSVSSCPRPLLCKKTPVALYSEANRSFITLGRKLVHGIDYPIDYARFHPLLGSAIMGICSHAPDRYRSFLNSYFSPAERLPCTFSNLATAAWCANASTPALLRLCCWPWKMASPTSLPPLKFWSGQALSDGRWTIITVGATLSVSGTVGPKIPCSKPGRLLEDREAPVEAQCRRKLIEEYETCHTLIFNSLPQR